MEELSSQSSESSSLYKSHSSFSKICISHSLQRHLCVQMSQQVCFPLSFAMMSPRRSCDRNCSIKATLRHLLSLMHNSFIAMSVFRRCIELYSINAQAGVLSRPTRPIACTKSTNSLGGPYNITL